MLYFAHGGVEHDTVTEEATHLFMTEWYVALPVLLVLLGLVAMLVYRATKSLVAAYLMVACGLFIAGVSMYNLSPVTSIVSLSLGFGLILTQVLTDLQGSRTARYNNGIKEKKK